MSRFIQLILLCVVTLSYIQLGRLQCDVESVSGAVVQVLLPIINDIKDDLSSVRKELTSLNASMSKSVSHLSGDLEQHKNQTASLLADLQSSINRLHTEQLTLIHDGKDTLESVITKGLKYVKDRLDSQIDELDFKIQWSCVYQVNTSDDNASPSPICTGSCTDQVNNSDEKTQPPPIPIYNGTDQVNNSDENVPSPQIPICNDTTGWRRAVYLDMTDPNTNCPRGWNMTDYSKRTCGRATDAYRICDSVTFSVSGGEYSQVCGRIRAYQWGWTSAFLGYSITQTTVNDAYFSGVAVMHGSPRQHIWTFTSGVAENHRDNVHSLCPCDTIQHIPIPPFVDEDYFCESGYIYPGRWIPDDIDAFHSNDTLWDGKDCHSSSTCCSRLNPPYFIKTLNTSTTDDIELRMCHYYSYGDTAVELVELYVK